jgi:hypothetical protein
MGKFWLLLSGLLLLPAQAAAQVVINEIEVDDIGIDLAEFIELKNTGGAAVNLDSFSVQLINGGDSTAYFTVDLPNVALAAGDYFVICGSRLTIPNCDLDGGSDIEFLADGPDAIALRDGVTLVDALAYGGAVAGYTEGTAAPNDVTTNYTGLSRFPDGADTNNNSVDVSVRCQTPGVANSSADTGCPTPIGCGDGISHVTEDCDLGAANGTTICGCQFNCTYGAASTACGSTADTECANPDTCDGLGTCLSRDEAPTANCGDTGTECTLQDKCNGAGSCTDNGYQVDGTLCSGGACAAGMCVLLSDDAGADSGMGVIDSGSSVDSGNGGTVDASGPAPVTDADAPDADAFDDGSSGTPIFDAGGNASGGSAAGTGGGAGNGSSNGGASGQGASGSPPSTPSDGLTPDGGGGVNGGDDPSGCDCSLLGAPPSAGPWPLLFWVLALRRRRGCATG